MRHLLLALLFGMSAVLPAGAATGFALIPQTAGQRVMYRLVRSVQTTNGPQATTVSFAVVRRTGGTVVVERTAAGGAPNLSILTAASDGTLALSDPRTMSSDGDLADILYALNIAVAAAREGDPNAGGTWLAVIPAAPAASATTAPLVLVPSTVAGGSFDFAGSMQSALAPGGDAHAQSAIVQTLKIDGHVTTGRVTRVTIVQQRTVIIAGQPYLNVGSWTLTVAP